MKTTTFVLCLLAANGSLAATAQDTSAARPESEQVAAYESMLIPHLQFWGFDNRDPVIDVGPYRMSFQIYTTENTFGMAADRVQRKQQAGGRIEVHASQLAWAGQQERAPGSIDVLAEPDGDKLSITLRATAKTPIRGSKLILYDLPGDRAAWSMDGVLRRVTKEGSLYQYPSWSAGLPVWYVGSSARGGLVFSSLDYQPRPKRFAVYRGQKGTNVELIYEEDARHWTTALETPAWEIRSGHTLEEGIESRLAYLEAKTGLKKWEDRTDTPGWVRDISLVVSIHGMHWSGYIFNDYAKALETVRWVVERIEPKRVLVFLPGWEGRYYWQYGDYRPEPRLGGPGGFKKMVDGMHQLGVHVMPMFGGNCANATFANYKQFGPQSAMISGTSLINQGNAPDWDLSRSRDTGWQQWLNPGAPEWQNHLVGQIESILDQYHVDGVFLDTQPNMENDVHYNPLEGLREICQRIRLRHNDLLITTESFNELSMGFVPVNHTPGGVGNWPSRYIRRFAYLADGEPSRGSTGVEEDGYVPYNLNELVERYDWPTVSFVEDTLSAAPEKVQAVIDRAKQYAQRHLK